MQSPGQWTDRGMQQIAKHTMKKCYDMNSDIYLVLLQMHSTPIEPQLLTQASLLFNRQTRGIL